MSTALDDVREDRAEVGEVVISCENVHKTYLLGVEGVAALRGVSVDVYGGELLVIYGTSGGGKSTLLNVLGTIDTPTKGNLAIFDARITDRTPDRVLAGLRNKKVGIRIPVLQPVVDDVGRRQRRAADDHRRRAQRR
jgi:predicted ABC-type transport system involved in lysophospholipase L1 biosynthesis ATPase subunit